MARYSSGMNCRGESRRNVNMDESHLKLQKLSGKRGLISSRRGPGAGMPSALGDIESRDDALCVKKPI